MEKYIETKDDKYINRTYENGSVIKTLILQNTTSPTPQVAPQPTLEDKVNYLYYKIKGVV